MIHPGALPLLAVCLMALSAAGCTPFRTGTPEAEPSPPAAVRPDPAETRLADAAVRAEAALTALAQIESARTLGVVARVPGRSAVPGSSPALEDVPAALRRTVTLDWIGPVETLAETLARRAGYRFMAAGSMPARPVMVTVRAADTPLIEVLRDAGLQAGAAATLVVDAGNRTVRLDWTADHPGPGELPRMGEHPDSRERSGSAPGKEGS